MAGKTKEPKGSRGRPRGSKNKNANENNNDTPSSSSSSKSLATINSLESSNNNSLDSNQNLTKNVILSQFAEPSASEYQSAYLTPISATTDSNKRSWVWQWFTLSSDKKSIHCVLCKKTYEYCRSTTIMSFHLQSGRHYFNRNFI